MGILDELKKLTHPYDDEDEEYEDFEDSSYYTPYKYSDDNNDSWDDDSWDSGWDSNDSWDSGYDDWGSDW